MLVCTGDGRGKKMRKCVHGKVWERGKNSGILAGSEAFNTVGTVVATGSEQVIYR